jgi:hypothetical protein
MPSCFFRSVNYVGENRPSEHDGIRFIEARINSSMPHLPSASFAQSLLRNYNSYVLRHLVRHVEASHCLIIHRDGYIVHPKLWRDDFLCYDYVGAPWPHRKGTVGNGGFSLRSKRFMQWLADYPVKDFKTPEDHWICITIREAAENAGFRFPGTRLAHRFSVEASGDLAKAFGFHQVVKGHPLRRLL